VKINKIDLKYLKSSIIIEIFVGLIAGLSLFIWQMFFISDLSLLDLKFKIRSYYFENIKKIKQDDNIVIIYIPEDVYIEYGYPEITPRIYLNKLIQKISTYNPQIIAFDFYFDQKDGTHDIELINTFNKLKSNNKIILGFRKVKTIDGYSTGVTKILDEYISSVYSIGYLNIKNDEKGMARYFYLTTNGIPSLAHEIIACKNNESKVIPDRSETNWTPKNTRAFFINKYGSGIYNHSIDINYYKEQNPNNQLFLNYSSEDLLKPEGGMDNFFKNIIKNKIVLIGSGSYNRDIHKTPLADEMQGVLIQATILKNFLDNNFIIRIHWLITIILIILMSLVSFLISYNYKIFKINILILLQIFLYCVFSFLVFILWNLLLPSIPITIAIFVTALITIFIRILYTEQTKNIEELEIAKYFPIYTIKKILKIKDIYSTKKTEAVILTCYINNISSITENIPEKIEEFFSIFYQKIKDIIFSMEGSYNNLSSNGILGFWNMENRINYYEKAIDTAYEIIENIDIINLKAKKILKFFDEFYITIVIHKGNVISGYFGANDTKDFTIIGEAVNQCIMINQQLNSENKNQVFITDKLKQEIKQIKIKEEMSINKLNLYKI